MNKKHEYLCKQAGVSVGERGKEKRGERVSEREKERERAETLEIP